jgi:hypothetical protein
MSVGSARRYQKERVITEYEPGFGAPNVRTPIRCRGASRPFEILCHSVTGDVRSVDGGQTCRQNEESIEVRQPSSVVGAIFSGYISHGVAQVIYQHPNEPNIGWNTAPLWQGGIEIDKEMLLPAVQCTAGNLTVRHSYSSPPAGPVTVTLLANRSETQVACTIPLDN